MNLTLQISNADENLLKVSKGVINLHPKAKIKVKKEYEYDESTEEIEEALKNSYTLTQYTSFQQLLDDVEKEIKEEEKEKNNA